MNPSTRTRALPLLLVPLFAAGCSDTPPTQPARPPEADAPTARLQLAPAEAAGFAATLEDARTRLLPALGEAPEAAALGQALDALAAALAARDPAALVQALERSDAALAGLAAAEAERAAALAADLEAVRLIVAEARPLPARVAPAAR